MNTIFIDIYSKHANTKKDKYLKFKVLKDIKNDEFNKNIFLQIDTKLLNSILKNRSKLSQRLLKLFLKREYKKDKELLIVFSKEIDKNKDYKRCIKNLFLQTLEENLKIIEISVKNNMLEHDIFYIDSILEKNKIIKSRANILMVIDSIFDFNYDKILEYIKRYRYLDILELDGISKVEHNTLLNKINNINDEYGTTIEIIKKRNILEYDVYVFYSNINVEDFKNQYVLNQDTKIIETKNEDADTINLSYRMYRKNKEKLEDLFSRLDCNIERFSKSKLGTLFIKIS